MSTIFNFSLKVFLAFSLLAENCFAIDQIYKDMFESPAYEIGGASSFYLESHFSPTVSGISEVLKNYNLNGKSELICSRLRDVFPYKYKDEDDCEKIVAIWLVSLALIKQGYLEAAFKQIKEATYYINRLKTDVKYIKGKTSIEKDQIFSEMLNFLLVESTKSVGHISLQQSQRLATFWQQYLTTPDYQFSSNLNMGLNRTIDTGKVLGISTLVALVSGMVTLALGMAGEIVFEHILEWHYFGYEYTGKCLGVAKYITAGTFIASNLVGFTNEKLQCLSFKRFKKGISRCQSTLDEAALRNAEDSFE